MISLNTNNSLEQNFSQINDALRRIENESVTKVFKQAGNQNAIINGKLPYDGGYGSLYYDSNGVARIVLGILPDGTMGLVVSKDGIDVLSLFS